MQNVNSYCDPRVGRERIAIKLSLTIGNNWDNAGGSRERHDIDSAVVCSLFAFEFICILNSHIVYTQSGIRSGVRFTLLSQASAFACYQLAMICLIYFVVPQFGWWEHRVHDSRPKKTRCEAGGVRGRSVHLFPMSTEWHVTHRTKRGMRYE